MNGYDIFFIPDFPREILSENRQKAIKKTIPDRRRVLEKMYGECFDNFRRQLEDGMSRKKICSIVLFFQQHRINITLDSFAENQVDIRITSPLVNSILRMQNPKSIVVLCEALNYPVPEIYFQKPEEVPKVDSEMNEKTEQKKTRKKRPPSHHTHKKEKKKKSLFTRILGL